VDWLRQILFSNEFIPHGHCFSWRPGLMTLHVGSDTLIGTAYVVISLTLYGLVRRIRLPFSPMFLAFGLFIGACGLTHYMEVWTLWVPDYWLSGAIKAVTAAASVATGVYLVRARRTILQVTRGAQLAEERRVHIEAQNRELSALYSRVKELDDAKTRFFLNVSHELRTPLALVLGPIEKRVEAERDPAARRDLEIARRNARLLLRHVDDLLDVARLEEGRLEVRWRRVDLAALVRDVAGYFDALASDRRVELAVDAPPAAPAVLDPEQMGRVLVNLLSNAFKFVPDGGHVRCALAVDGGRAMLTVDDDGPGIPAEQREAVFERFHQGAGRSGAAAGGAGLGLAIARELVTLHAGTIEADRAPGGGARLRISLPLQAPPGSAVEDAAPAVHPAAQAGAAAEALRRDGEAAPPGDAPRDAATVLVVEDQPEMRALVAEALGAAFHVVSASDGAEALQVAEALRPDLVVTDVMMPRLDGERLVSELRARAALRDLPVIVLTARADEALRATLLQGGASDYVVKPFRAEELRARAANAVAMKRSRDALAGALERPEGDVEAMARELVRRKRELELVAETARVAREQAENASRVKSSFLGMLSHELRTPLAAMQLSITALKADREGTLGERQRGQLARLERAAARLLGLIEALLEYTRVEAGKMVVQPREVNLAELAAEVVEESLPEAQRKLLALELAPAPPLPLARTDPRLVRLVLVNLVVNAIKYTEQGRVGVAVSHDGRAHVLEVSDTGPGIPPADRMRIFEPFQQLGRPGVAQGVGLGLSLVKGVSEALGGELSVDSEVGCGSVFRLRLPSEPPAAQVAEGSVPPAAP
jgi:signal transduction histidine kinase